MILLVGLPQLNHTLRLSIHEPLRQRIIMNYNLEGCYTKEEGREYIEIKLSGAGCHQTVFGEDAVEAILNASFAETEIIEYPYINLSMAVATDYGLTSPVVKNADSMSLTELSLALRDLTIRARDRRLTPDDQRDGTYVCPVDVFDNEGKTIEF